MEVKDLIFDCESKVEWHILYVVFVRYCGRGGLMFEPWTSQADPVRYTSVICCVH